MTTSVDIVNRALALIDDQDEIAAFNDGTPAGDAAGLLYTATVQMLLRRLDPEFARTRVALVLAVGTVMPDPWTYAYQYPATCIRLRQVAPMPGQYDPNDPQPVRAEVSWDAVAGKVILTNQQSAVGVITSSTPNENLWDANFAEAVMRRLANPLAMAVAGRPDFAREVLEEAQADAQRAELNEL